MGLYHVVNPTGALYRTEQNRLLSRARNVGWGSESNIRKHATNIHERPAARRPKKGKGKGKGKGGEKEAPKKEAPKKEEAPAKTRGRPAGFLAM